MIKLALIPLAAVLLLAGCQSSKNVVSKNKNDMLLMDQQAQLAHAAFAQGDYNTAENKLIPLTLERHVNQTLYQCELASAYLLDGEKEKAHEILLSIHESIEGFFDQKSEKKAASLWGKESSKVYKGDPYERGALYFLLSLSMLERGDIDNALAALKTGMLADSDTEDQTYTADFGLLQLIAAKCYAIRGEDEMRDQMLDAAFKSFTSIPETSDIFAKELLAEYNLQKAKGGQITPPSNLLARLCALTSKDEIVHWLRANGLSSEKSDAVAEWAEVTTSEMAPLNFNTLVIVWKGTAPYMTRAGEYGERRVIVPGIDPCDTTCSFLLGETDIDPCGGFGDLNYQATTRGGRAMDNVLAKQAAFKGATDGAGDAAFELAQQDYGDPMVNLAAMGIGLAFKGIAMATKTEADVRCWKNLPHSFEIIPLNLPPGTHNASIRQWKHGIPLTEKELLFTSDENKPLTVVHTRPPAVGTKVAEWFFPTPADYAIYTLAQTTLDGVDVNGDGELSDTEMAAAYSKLLASADSNGDGILSSYEELSAKRNLNKIFSTGMLEK